MSRRLFTAALALAVAVPLLVAANPSRADDRCAGVFCAGAASVDMTWHTGSGQGQLGGAGNHASENKFDPYHHTTKMTPTDGMQSRTFAKAIVVQGADGAKAAYVKTELYLQQDILSRRVAELVSGADPASEYAVDGLDASTIMLMGTHNHSAPYYASTAWGVWIFADAFDYRMFETTARDIARSIAEADESLRPAKMGASVTRFADAQQNILGPSVADDGSPSGFPRDHFDDELAVIRFDAVPDDEPIGAIVSLGMHPESIGGNANLISGDFIGVVERDVERALGREPGAADGPVVAWSQGGLGDVEPDQSRANPAAAGREYWRRDFAQTEKMSAGISAAVVQTWDDIAAGTPDVADKFVPFSTDVPVQMLSYRFPGPVSHPVPTVSNCRTAKPGIPVIGFPDCERLPDPPGWGATHDLLKGAGLPVPDQYGAPSYGAVHEGMTIHLQTLALGEVLLASCPCEPITDMTLNFKTRADALDGNEFAGYEWTCREGGDTGVECDFRHAAWQPEDWRPVDPDAHARMVAQVRNDAAGWEDDLATIQGASEPADPEEIKGNFTRGELGSEQGFRLPLMVGTANDYVGYVVTYREYQRGDHYRKALTAFGPRTADYINTRLVAMAAELRGGPEARDALDTGRATVDELIQTGKVKILGAGGSGGLAAYEAALPDDGGTPGEVVTQPADRIEWFDAATFVWEGGSNYTDNPSVVVQRLDGDDWRTVATQEGGEVVVTLDYASWSSSAPLDWLTGGQTYTWTATFEAFQDVAPGTYRFAVDGHHRSGREAVAYEVTSDAFDVDVWHGLEVTDLQVDRAVGTVTFQVAGEESRTAEDQLPGPISIAADAVRYPATHDSDIPFIGHQIFERGPLRYCFRCTFRAWADNGRVVTAEVTVERPAAQRAQSPRVGSTPVVSTHEATFDGSRWVVTGLDLDENTVVRIAPGGILDELGNTNGEEARS